jgi:hypothetical protein
MAIEADRRAWWKDLVWSCVGGWVRVVGGEVAILGLPPAREKSAEHGIHCNRAARQKRLLRWVCRCRMSIIWEGDVCDTGAR